MRIGWRPCTIYKLHIHICFIRLSIALKQIDLSSWSITVFTLIANSFLIFYHDCSGMISAFSSAQRWTLALQIAGMASTGGVSFDACTCFSDVSASVPPSYFVIIFSGYGKLRISFVVRSMPHTTEDMITRNCCLAACALARKLGSVRVCIISGNMSRCKLPLLDTTHACI